MVRKIVLDENDNYGKVELAFKVFHTRRINDAIWGMASVCNDHGKNGTCTGDGMYILTNDSSREVRLDEIICSLRCINVMTHDEERVIKKALSELRNPPSKCPCCGKEMD